MQTHSDTNKYKCNNNNKQPTTTTNYHRCSANLQGKKKTKKKHEEWRSIREDANDTSHLQATIHKYLGMCI